MERGGGREKEKQKEREKVREPPLDLLHGPPSDAFPGAELKVEHMGLELLCIWDAQKLSLLFHSAGHTFFFF